jgi:hypothetical protein
MRTHFDDTLVKSRVDKNADPENIETFMYMSFWYGELYVVVEGWQELKLADPRVDALLEDTEMVGLLRRYRHGTFHFQGNYWDDRFIDFVKVGAKSAAWVRKLNKAFGAYFLKEFKVPANQAL